MINGCLMQRQLPDGRILALMPLFEGRARITVGVDQFGYDEGW
jgi:hypothetical protein